MTSVPNPVKELFKAGKVALGMNVRLARSGDIARIAKSSAHDFIFIDIQHSLFTIETIGHIAQVALGCGVAPLVRVRSCDDPDTSTLLDNGVTGIVFPDISTATEAQRAVNRAKFPPVGKRSVSKAHGKVPGVGGDRNIARQAEFIRKGARFITTNSDIAFMMAEASRVTGELRTALEQK